MFVSSMDEQQPGPSTVKRIKTNYDYEDQEVFHLNVEDSDSECGGETSDSEENEEEEEDIKVADTFNDINELTWTDVGAMNDIAFTGLAGLLRMPSGTSPMDYFNLLVDQNYYETIVEETNAYANDILIHSDKKNKKVADWQDLNVAELRQFIGLLLHMGTIQINGVRNYWTNHRLFDLKCFSRHMSANRFCLILHCLRFVKPGNSEPRLFKIKPIVDYFNRKMCEVYYPDKQLSLKDSLIAFGKDLRYTREKSKYDIKLYVLTEPNGLTLKMKVYTGSKGQAGGVVLYLLEEKLNKGHSVYLDSSYNSISLTEKLLSCNTYCTGTLRNNVVQKSYCKEVVQADLKKGEMISKYYNGIVMGKWREKRTVLFISSEHTEELAKVHKKSGELKQKPKAIIEYDKFMCGINLRNQMLSYYAYDKKSFRWYIKLWAHVLDNLMLNAFFLYNEYSGNDKLNFYDYRLSIINNLLFENLPVDEPVIKSAPGHLPQKFGKSEAGHTKRKRCRYCYKMGIRKETPYFCPMCADQPGLCLHPCFGLFHNH